MTTQVKAVKVEPAEIIFDNVSSRSLEALPFKRSSKSESNWAQPCYFAKHWINDFRDLFELFVASDPHYYYSDTAHTVVRRDKCNLRNYAL